MRSLLGWCAMCALLGACSTPPGNPIHNFEHNVTKQTPVFYVAALALMTPPLNTMVFGPCEDEFGMPDGRRTNCNIYYYFVRHEAPPWEQRKFDYATAAYKPGELQCWRTRGNVAECSVVSGPPHMAPSIVAPNNMGAQ